VDAANEGVAEATFDSAEIDLETVFRAQYGRIARVIAGVIRDPARAEELAVEVFLKWERTRLARSEGAEGWLHRAAVRVALSELRRRTVISRYERVIAFVTAGRIPATPDEIYAAADERQRVRQVLNAIAPRHAELLLLRANDLSYQELATALNLNTVSVGKLLGRAAEAFRKEFVRRHGKERYGEE